MRKPIYSGHNHKIALVVNNHVINCVTVGIGIINVSYMIRYLHIILGSGFQYFKTVTCMC